MSRRTIEGLYNVCDYIAGEEYIRKMKQERTSKDKLYNLEHKFLNREYKKGFLTIDEYGDLTLESNIECIGTINKFRTSDIIDIENKGNDLTNFERVRVENE